MGTKPNIVFIVLDTLRRDRLGLYGYPQESSPHLDAFAQAATVYERAMATAQWTVPSHASMFTGLYPRQHQLLQVDGCLSEMQPTLAEILQVDGYHTVGFCNNPLVGVLYNGLQRGFTNFYNYAGVKPNYPVDTITGAVRGRMEALWAEGLRRFSTQFAHDGLLFRLSLRKRMMPLWMKRVHNKGNTRRSIQDTIDFLEAYQEEAPYFAFINLMGSHLPYQPPSEDLEFISPEIYKSKVARQYMQAFNADASQWLLPPDPAFEDWQAATLDAFYSAEVRAQDRELGRLLDYLEKSGQLADTLVIITADHGEGLGDHGFFGHGFVVNQELVHVPLIIHYPERFQAGFVPETVSTRRIFHTVLDVLDLIPPIDESDANADVKGLSLLNQAPTATQATETLSEAIAPDNFISIVRSRRPDLIQKRQLTMPRRALYQGDYKLMLLGESVEAFYHVGQDPLEEINLMQIYPEEVEKMKIVLLEALARLSAGGALGATQQMIDPLVLQNLRELGYVD
ncbi:sulfatase [Anaerolineales bacterium]